jgi:hypothetical protein
MSDRRMKANRRNAAHSTGPRTTEGKQRASRNACKHGWSLTISHIPEISQKIEAMAVRLAGNNAKPRRLQTSRELLEALFVDRHLLGFELSLLEIDDTYIHTIAGMLADRTGEGDASSQMSQTAVQYDQDIEGKLRAIALYRKRAQSKLWRSMIKFQAAKDEDDEALR